MQGQQTENPQESIIADALSKEGVSGALSQLVRTEINEQIKVTRAARDEASRASTLDGFMSAALVTLGIALGTAAAMELLPVVTLTAIGAGVAGTFGVLLGIAAVNNREDARKLDSTLRQLEEASTQAKDKNVVLDIAQEKLFNQLPDERQQVSGKSWTQKVGDAAQQPSHTHSV